MAIIGDILDFSKIESRKLTLDREPFALRHDAERRDRDAARPRGRQVAGARARRARRGARHARRRCDAPAAGADQPARQRHQVHRSGEGAAARRDRERACPGEVCLHFAVIDTGIGIPRDKQEVVFDAFAQADGSAARRYGGTGLGLSISARLVELMGGDIWVESEEGAGLGIPLHRDVRTATRCGPRPGAGTLAAGPRGPLSVLVVEDEDVHRELVAALLLGRGHHVITAKNGREALIELSRHTVDIALMDLQMPELDGMQAAATIREWERSTGGHLPIVAMTASALADDPEQVPRRRHGPLRDQADRARPALHARRGDRRRHEACRSRVAAGACRAPGVSGGPRRRPRARAQADRACSSRRARSCSTRSAPRSTRGTATRCGARRTR